MIFDDLHGLWDFTIWTIYYESMKSMIWYNSSQVSHHCMYVCFHLKCCMHPYILSTFSLCWPSSTILFSCSIWSAGKGVLIVQGLVLVVSVQRHCIFFCRPYWVGWLGVMTHLCTGNTSRGFIDSSSGWCIQSPSCICICVSRIVFF